jgi:hypothetical protein
MSTKNSLSRKAFFIFLFFIFSFLFLKNHI